MPFPLKIREWVIRVQGGRCLAYHYTDQGGFVRCKNKIEHIHHIQPESWVLAGNEEFTDPNNGSVPIGLCKADHAKIHPDQALALEQYRNGDKDSFKKMAKRQHEMAERGEIYWNNDGDISMLQRARWVQMRWIMEHPEDKKPTVKPHKQAKQKRHWWDIF